MCYKVKKSAKNALVLHKITEKAPKAPFYRGFESDWEKVKRSLVWKACVESLLPGIFE